MLDLVSDIDPTEKEGQVSSKPSVAHLDLNRHAKLRVVTGGSSATPSNSVGKPEPFFSYKDVVSRTVERAKVFGYETAVYDLGGLGVGRKFEVNNQKFKERGHFDLATPEFLGKGAFKPDLLLESTRENAIFTVWLDGDALLVDPIDEVVGDYDLGVTIRHPLETQGPWWERNAAAIGYINTGVVFINPSHKMNAFLAEWSRRSFEGGGSDQWGLNRMLELSELPEPWSTREINGIRLKFFPAEIYNFFYFRLLETSASERSLYMPKPKVLHFKGGTRQHYQTYCEVGIEAKSRPRWAGASE